MERDAPPPVTSTQPNPNRSTPHATGAATDGGTTEQQPNPNISTEHQQQGDARRPTDQLDKGQTIGGQSEGGPTIPRKTSLT